MKEGISLDTIRQKLVNPIVVDNSISELGSEENNNIETTESFQVFFPDGSMSQVSGGQESVEKFNEILHVALEKGYDIGFKANLAKEAVSDFRDNNLANACLLQFPYSRGGLQEQCLNKYGAFSESVDIEEYIGH
jgi:hypothetical protein